MLKRFTKSFTQLVINEQIQKSRTNHHYSRHKGWFILQPFTYLQNAIVSFFFQLKQTFGQENVEAYRNEGRFYYGEKTNVLFSIPKFLLTFMPRALELPVAGVTKLVDSAFKIPRWLISNMLDVTAELRRAAENGMGVFGRWVTVLLFIPDLLLHLADLTLFALNEVTQLAFDVIRGVVNTFTSPYNTLVKPLIERWVNSDRIGKGAIIAAGVLGLVLTAVLIASALFSGGASLGAMALLAKPLGTLLTPAFSAVAGALGSLATNVLFTAAAVLTLPILANVYASVKTGLKVTWNNMKRLGFELKNLYGPRFIAGTTSKESLLPTDHESLSNLVNGVHPKEVSTMTSAESRATEMLNRGAIMDKLGNVNPISILLYNAFPMQEADKPQNNPDAPLASLRGEGRLFAKLPTASAKADKDAYRLLDDTALTGDAGSTGWQPMQDTPTLD